VYGLEYINNCSNCKPGMICSCQSLVSSNLFYRYDDRNNSLCSNIGNPCQEGKFCASGSNRETANTFDCEDG